MYSAADPGVSRASRQAAVTAPLVHGLRSACARVLMLPMAIACSSAALSAPAASRCAQKRFAGDTRDMLEQWVDRKPFKPENYIVREGQLAPQYT